MFLLPTNLRRAMKLRENWGTDGGERVLEKRNATQNIMGAHTDGDHNNSDRRIWRLSVNGIRTSYFKFLTTDLI